MSHPPSTRGSFIRSPRDLAAGVSLVALAVLALWAGADLEFGRLQSPGPGFLPRATAVLVGVAGVGFCLGALVRGGGALDAWSLRGPALVTLGVLGFALTIRTGG